jgi:hypothetical protein
MPAMLRIIPLALLLIGSTGCANHTKKWVGTWEGMDETLVSPELAEENPVIAGTIQRVILTIKPDRTFELIRGGFPAIGNAALGEKEATLTITHLMDQPLEKLPKETQAQNQPITITFSDGKVELKDPTNFGKPSIALNKKAKQ